MQKPSLADVILWGLVTAGFWAFAGAVTAVVFFSNASRVPTTTPTPEHMRLLGYILAGWGAGGLVIGVLALFRFLAISSLVGPISA